MEHKTTGLEHLIKSTGYSLKGLKSAVKYETAFRHELFLGIFLVPLAFLLVLVAELLNSSVECVVDRVGKEHHELSGRAKDQGSAAVFVALVNCALMWALMLFG